MLWRTQPWFLWINVWKTCLVKLLPWIRRPSFGYSIFPSSHWFEISSGWSEQVTSPCIWTPLERCCYFSMHQATFIRQNQHICTTRRCAACMMSWTWMNSGLYRERLLRHPAQWQVLERCLVWYDQVLMRAIKVSGRLTRGRGITESTLAKWVCALPLCIPLCTAGEEFAGSHTESSEQHSKASDHQDLRPAQQARDQADLEQFIQWL